MGLLISFLKALGGMSNGGYDPLNRSTIGASMEEIPQTLFVSRWKSLVGEPPAVLLENRRTMLALLVESVPAANMPNHDPPPGQAVSDSEKS